MTKEIFFFATKNDLLSIINEVQRYESLKYIPTGSYLSKDIIEYLSLEKYENLGINKSGDHQTESFLVLRKTDRLRIREVEQTDGSLLYFVDQLENEDSIVLWPGGINKGEFLICGHASTINESKLSRVLFNYFSKNIKRLCKKQVGRYYIGEGAQSLYGEMRFITINVNQSTDYDLKM